MNIQTSIVILSCILYFFYNRYLKASRENNTGKVINYIYGMLLITAMLFMLVFSTFFK